MLKKLLGIEPRSPLQDYFDGNDDGTVVMPSDSTLEALESLLVSEKAFFAQMRAMGCQIALSSRLVKLLKSRGHPDIEGVLANVPVIQKRGRDAGGKLPHLLVASVADISTTNIVFETHKSNAKKG